MKMLWQKAWRLPMKYFYNDKYFYLFKYQNNRFKSVQSASSVFYPSHQSKILFKNPFKSAHSVSSAFHPSRQSKISSLIIRLNPPISVIRVLSFAPIQNIPVILFNEFSFSIYAQAICNKN